MSFKRNSAHVEREKERDPSLLKCSLLHKLAMARLKRRVHRGRKRKKGKGRNEREDESRGEMRRRKKKEKNKGA
jgi:hypothetical protein